MFSIFHCKRTPPNEIPENSSPYKPSTTFCFSRLPNSGWPVAPATYPGHSQFNLHCFLKRSTTLAMLLSCFLTHHLGSDKSKTQSKSSMGEGRAAYGSRLSASDSLYWPLSFLEKVGGGGVLQGGPQSFGSQYFTINTSKVTSTMSTWQSPRSPCSLSYRQLQPCSFLSRSIFHRVKRSSPQDNSRGSFSISTDPCKCYLAPPFFLNSISAAEAWQWKPFPGL